ncbi:Integrase/recombinase xerD like protein [Termitomyces sp. T112]|nr:Integrase/recombinase xerD like protein [Termitomyces sp. T112]
MLAACLVQQAIRARTTPSPHTLITEIPPHWYDAHANLSPRAAFYPWHRLASSTRKNYSTGQKSFIDFCRLNPSVLNEPGRYLPATDQAIVEWVCSLGDRALQPKTIKGYLAAVRSLHIDEGLPFGACESETVCRVIRGIKHYHGEHERNPKRPITLNILQKLSCATGDVSKPFQASFDAACKSAWAGFLCCGNFTLGHGEKFSPASHLTRGCITFLPSLDSPSHVRIDLPTSKTDLFHRGTSILLAKAPTGSFTCPVSALHTMFTVDPKPHNSPLFANPNGSPLTRDVFVSTLKQCLLECSFDPSGFSGHSFRRGAATAAAAVGYADHEIQLLGRWRSDAYKLYIDVPWEQILGLSARLHLAAPHVINFEPPSLLFAPVA